METQLAQAKCGELFDNPANLKAIDRHFAPPERPAVKTNGGGPRTGGTA
jgi:hypothetical protein